MIENLEQRINQELKDRNIQRQEIDLDKYMVDKYNSTKGKLRFIDCPKCLNKGSYMVLVEGKPLTIYCDCLKVRNAYQDIETNGLLEKVKICTFDTYKVNTEWQRFIKNKAWKFSKGGRMFFIGGSSGAGKTHICTAIYGKIIKENNFPSKYMLWNQDAKRLVAIKYEDNDLYQKEIAVFKDAKVLYIDDFLKPLGDRNPTTEVLSVAYDILDYRYNNSDLITIISSEKDTDKLIELDEAMAGRIIEGAGEYYITLSGKEKNSRIYRDLVK